MTIKNFVMQQKPMHVNGWISLINLSGFSKYEGEILAVADALKMIQCDLNSKPDFVGTIAKK